MKVDFFFDSTYRRSFVLCQAMGRGVTRCGDQFQAIEATPAQWGGTPLGDVAMAYGWIYKPAFDCYRHHGRDFVYFDLGFWGRKPRDRPWSGYHKVVVNDRDPNGYFRRLRPYDRFAEFGLWLNPWRDEGSTIIVAGMSAKSAAHHGYAPQQWETWAINQLRETTERQIIYRPKPSWPAATPIEGAGFSKATKDINRDGLWDDAWALVTHHSNCAVDALIAGVPIYTEKGVARDLSMTNLFDIEAPPLPDGRAQLMADIAYVQWSVAEMESGECWSHLKDEGLVCA